MVSIFDFFIVYILWLSYLLIMFVFQFLVCWTVMITYFIGMCHERVVRLNQPRACDLKNKLSTRFNLTKVIACANACLLLCVHARRYFRCLATTVSQHDKLGSTTKSSYAIWAAGVQVGEVLMSISAARAPVGEVFVSFWTAGFHVRDGGAPL